MKKLIIFSLLVFGLILIFWNIRSPVPNFGDRRDIVGSERVIPLSVGIESNKQEVIDENPFDQYIKSLPTLDDFQNLTEEEVHHTPELITEAGELIGRIHDEAENDPTKRVDALSFFKKCAEDDFVAGPIRAVCLNKIYKLVPGWKIPMALDESKISRDVSELALKLP